MSEIEKAIEQLNAELTDLVVIKESTFLLYGEKKKNLNDLISTRKLALQALQEKLERENVCECCDFSFSDVGSDMSNTGEKVVLLEDGIIAVDLVPICEYFEIDPERICEKEE